MLKGFLKTMKFKIKKNSPELLVGGGIVLGVVATVVACKSSVKAHDIIEEHNGKMQEIQEALDLNTDDYTETDAKNEVICSYKDLMIGLGKTYLPSLLLGSAAIASILAGANIHRQRNLALTAAYATLGKGFQEYRDRVVDTYGEDVDTDLRFGTKDEKIEVTYTDDDGKDKKKKVKTKTLDENVRIYGENVKFFDAASRQWEDNAEYNLNFLTGTLKSFQEELPKDRVIVLNEVLKYLDIPQTQYGATHGWVWNTDPDQPTTVIDFGIHDVTKVANRNFVNGYEPVILLEFNCEDIYDKI